MRARKSTREPPRDDLWNLRVGLRCELVCEGAYCEYYFGLIRRGLSKPFSVS
jgi:hypothetical protein